MSRRTALVVIGLGVLAVVVGCSGTHDKQIGEGPASLLFENDGSDTISVEVEWDDETGQRRHRSFDLDGLGRTELRLPDQSWYRVILQTQCDTDCATQEVERDWRPDPGPPQGGPAGANGVP
jgi:hypothetical protein